MEGAWLLAEPGAGDDADAGGLEQVEGVEHVGRLTSLCRRSDSRVRHFHLDRQKIVENVGTFNCTYVKYEILKGHFQLQN